MKISLCRLAATTGLCTVICIAKAQGIGSAGMSPPLNQIEAIESHLQHSRTQSKREVAKPASNSPVTKKKKPDAEGKKPKSSIAPAVK